MDEVVRMLDQLWFRSRDYCDIPSDSMAQSLQSEVKVLHGEAKQGKSPDYLVDKTNNLQNLVDSFKQKTDVYDRQDVDDMYDRLEDIKKSLRRL